MLNVSQKNNFRIRINQKCRRDIYSFDSKSLSLIGRSIIYSYKINLRSGRLKYQKVYIKEKVRQVNLRFRTRLKEKNLGTVRKHPFSTSRISRRINKLLNDLKRTPTRPSGTHKLVFINKMFM